VPFLSQIHVEPDVFDPRRCALEMNGMAAIQVIRLKWRNGNRAGLKLVERAV